MRSFVISGGCLCVVLNAGPLIAQDDGALAESDSPSHVEDNQSAITYDIDFFAAFSPITALEIVERVPGFSIDSGDNVRGFGGAAGNVLINGERPSAKGQSLVEILGQIPAKSVIRVELIRGRMPGIDMRGQSTIANVITETSDTNSFAELELRLSEGKHLAASAETSVTGNVAGIDYTLGVKRFVFEDIDDQMETLLAPDGTVLETRPEDADIIPKQWTITANLAGELGGWSLRNNNKAFFSDLSFREVSPAFDAETGNLLRTNTTLVRTKTQRLEIGADIERSLSESVELKLIGLQTLRSSDSQQSFDEDRPGAGATRVSQQIEDDSGESILRAVIAVTPRRSQTFEIGAEGAFNFLESNVALFVDDGDGPIPQDLPVSDVRVEEYRLEPFMNASWRISPRLNLEAGITVELSSLEQSGDASEKRSFLFAKPSVGLTYDYSKKDQLRLRFERDVAQLDFSDFVSSVTLNDQTTDLGNPDLEPQRDWVLTAEWERRFSKTDSLTLLLERKWLEQVQILVPVMQSFDAPGNVDSGSQWRARVDWQFALDRFGLKNAIFEGFYQFLDSELEDPVTGQPRQLSFTGPNGDPFRRHQTRLEFRQDFPEAEWAWGMEYFYGSSFQEFRLDELRTISFGAQDLDIFIQTTRFLDLQLRLEAGISEPRVLRERVFFDGSRAQGEVRAIEIRDRGAEQQLLFSVRKTF